MKPGFTVSSNTNIYHSLLLYLSHYYSCYSKTTKVFKGTFLDTAVIEMMVILAVLRGLIFRAQIILCLKLISHGLI